MELLIGSSLKSKTGDAQTKDVNTKVVALYFSASWCPPCRAFTPQLVDWYNEVNDGEKKVEIIFASLDKKEKDWEDYYAKMPWLSLPFGSAVIKQLAGKF